MEKREAQRVAPYLAVCRVVEGDQLAKGYVTDLSPKGARISCEGTAPAPGAKISIEVRLTGRKKQSVLSGAVKWSRGPDGKDGLSDFGLVFEGLTPGDRAELEAGIEEFKRRAATLS